MTDLYASETTRSQEVYNYQGQEHIWAHIGELNDSEIAHLKLQTLVWKSQVYNEPTHQSIDPTLVGQIWRQLTRSSQGLAQHASQRLIPQEKPKVSIDPFTEMNHLRSIKDEDKSRWEALGLELIAKGQVGALLLAGGQVCW